MFNDAIAYSDIQPLVAV